MKNLPAYAFDRADHFSGPTSERKAGIPGIEVFKMEVLSQNSSGVSKRLSQSVQFRQVLLAVDLMMKHLKHPLKFVEIARMVNMSSSSLLRQFRLAFGETIQEFYVHRKLEIAQQLLQDRNLTVKKVAESLGYSQVSSFIEVFSKRYGYTPGAVEVDRGLGK